MCTRSVEVLRRLDWLKRLVNMDANDVESVREAFPSLPTENLLHEMHVVAQSGRYWTGFFGFRRLAWALPLTWLIAPFLYVPGVPLVGKPIYAYVAANRTRNLCDSDYCLAKWEKR